MPLIIVAPAVTRPGSRRDETVSLVDLYPTLVARAGLPPTECLDGQNLVQLLKNPQADHAEPAITTWLDGNQAVRSKDWRYNGYRDGSEELYRDDDPWNLHNLAGNPDLVPILAKHRNWIIQ